MMPDAFYIGLGRMMRAIAGECTIDVMLLL
jgi:hypothetical protein